MSENTCPRRVEGIEKGGEKNCSVVVFVRFLMYTIAGDRFLALDVPEVRPAWIPVIAHTLLDLETHLLVMVG